MSPELGFEDREGGNKKVCDQVMRASGLHKVTASRENLAHSRNFREFSMVEIQQVGKRIRETETGDGSGLVCLSQEI